MSRELEAETETGTMRQAIQLACFRVGDAMYALDILRIKEIIRPQKMTRVPKAPDFVEGVINLRGAVIPIIDLRKRFELSASSGDDRKTRVIICSLAGKILGLMVDEVAEVRRYGRQEIQPTPQYLKGRGAEFFHGVCRRDEELIMVIDLERILSSGERMDLDQIARMQQEERPGV